MSKQVILTGLRSNSAFHIGNYLGAIAPTINMQRSHGGDYQINMFIPDLHSFTTPIDHGSLYQQTLDNLKAYIAAGLDINEPNTFIYRQSYISAHSEMTWILSCFTYFGELRRMTQFKDKSEQLSTHEMERSISAGLFNYPIMMAADILLYDAVLIPVGEDQRQHLELARDIAIRFNNRFGEIFTVPYEWSKQLELSGRNQSLRIRSLKNPEKKMSKSSNDPSGTIMLNDDPAEAEKKIMSATTDSLNSIKYDWKNQPGVTNLLELRNWLTELKTGVKPDVYQNETGYAELKKEVAELVKDFLIDFQAKLAKVDEKQLIAKLEDDEAKLREVAANKLYKVQQAIGLRP